MSDDAAKWLQENKLNDCHVFSASISKHQCNRNRKYYQKGLEKGYITMKQPTKLKRAVYCSSVCNGLDSKENISGDTATIA